MKILVHTDNYLSNSVDLTESVQAQITSSLEKYASHITRVEVHFQDENKNKGGSNDKRCALEVRLEHYDPVTVTEYAGTVADSLRGAIKKACRVVGDIVKQNQAKR